MSRGAGSGKDQATRKAAELERARRDPLFSRARFGTFPPPEPVTKKQAEAARRLVVANEAPARRARASGQASADAEYRAALGVPEGAPLPTKLGQAQSSGAARGGKGAAQKGKGTRK